MTVSEQIIQVIDALADKIGIAVDWTSQNVAPVVQQICERYIRYEIVMSIIWMVIELGIIAGFIFGGIKLFKFLIKAKKDPEYKRNYCCWADICMIVFGICAGMSGIFLVLDVFANMGTLCKCLLLPELHLFEELSSLLK